MSEGYFIGLGDNTTCGGKVLDGDDRINLHGLLHACEGDRGSCGKDGKTYRVRGGVSHMESHGRLMAGTLDSFSDGPCKARLIPSAFPVGAWCTTGTRPGRRDRLQVMPRMWRQPVVRRSRRGVISRASSLRYGVPTSQAPCISTLMGQ